MQAARTRLPNRSEAEHISFSHHGIQYSATIGFHRDGSVGEIFLNGGKLDSNADIMARDAAIAASLAIQHGAPLATLADALTRKAW